jgi:hypothetical protein
MDNFDLKKYLAEGRLFKEEVESINITPQQKRDFINQIKYFIKDEDFNTAMQNAGSILARILTNNEAEFIEDVEDFGYNSDEVEEYAQDLVGNLNPLNKENSLEQQEDILSFLKNNKAELIQVLAKKYSWDEDDIEFQSEYEIGPGADIDGNEDPEVAGLGESGLDFSFNPEKVKDEYGDASNFTIRVGGKTIYGIVYNM